VSYSAHAHWIPGVLGIGGMVTLFYGCVMLLRETRLAIRAVDSEMAFVLEINALYRKEGRREDQTISPPAVRRASRAAARSRSLTRT